MKLRVQSIHFSADKKLLDFIDKKAEKIGQVFDQIVDGEVFLKLDKAEDEKNKITEIKIHLRGTTLFAKEQCKTFEEGIDLAIESIQRQIARHKDKIKAHDIVGDFSFDELAD